MEAEDIKQAIRNGTTVQLNDKTLLPGVRVKINRQSKKTGNLSVEILEKVDGSGYEVGNILHVMPYCVESAQPRHEELISDYNYDCQGAVNSLNRYVTHGRIEREKFARQILEDQTDSTKQDYVELLVYRVRGGYGVKEDILASMARKILATIDRGNSVEQALRYAKEDLEAQLLRNYHGGGSSSSYVNAVAEDYRRACKDMYEFVKFELTIISNSRAQIEVL